MKGKTLQENIKEKSDWQSIPVDERKKSNILNLKYDSDKTTIVVMGDEHIGSRFYDEDTHKRNVEWCYENDVPIILMGDELECMDMETQILTEKGWKFFWELGNLKVATYNIERDEIEYQKPIKKVYYKYKGKMYHFLNKKLDMFVTPNHRILCRHHKDKLEVRRADKFTIKSAKARCWNVPCSASWNKGLEEYGISDDEIKLIAWIITEGWIEKRGLSYRYYTSQKNGTKESVEINKIFNKLNIKPHIKYNKQTNVLTWRFTDKNGKFKKLIGKKTKRITREILNKFSERQLKILYKILLKGDGGKRGEFFTISKQLKDDFLELCCKIGLVTSVTKTKTTKGPTSNDKWKPRDFWIIYTGNGKGNKKTKKMKHKTITDLDIVDFDGEVWCVSVPNSFLVVKRNDRVFITGNTATRDSVGAGVFEQDEIVQEQLEHAERIYKPLAEKGLILGNHIGNHEARVYNHSGANLSKILAKLLDIKYLGVGAITNIKVGKNNYTLYTTHGSSGSRLPHTKIKAVLDLANMIDVDIYAMGHLHALDHHVRNMYYFDKRNKTIKEKQKHFILTGSYLKHWGSYAHIKGMEPARIGSPKIKLSGLERRIRVSL